MAMERKDDNFVFEIKAHLGVISARKEGWKKELNLVSWNGQDPPKFDIRDWSEDHTKMSRGITLYDSEMRRVVQYYTQFCNARVVSEGRNTRRAAAQAGLKVGEETSEEQQKQSAKASVAEEQGAASAAAEEQDAKEPLAEEQEENAAVLDEHGVREDIPEVPQAVIQGADVSGTVAEETPF